MASMSLSKRVTKKAARHEEIIIPTNSTSVSAKSPRCAVCQRMSPVLGNGIFAAEASEEQHRAAHVPQARCRSVVRIKKLLYDDGFTIAGALQLREETKSERNQSALPFP